MKFDKKHCNSRIPTTETRFSLNYFVYFDKYINISIISKELGSKYLKDMPKPLISWIFLSIMNEVRWKTLKFTYTNPRDSFFLKTFCIFWSNSNIAIILEEIGSKYRNDTPKPPISWIILSIMKEVQCKTL